MAHREVDEEAIKKEGEGEGLRYFFLFFFSPGEQCSNSQRKQD